MSVYPELKTVARLNAEPPADPCGKSRRGDGAGARVTEQMAGVR